MNAAVTGPGFQFLLGRLETLRLAATVSTKSRFQFLLGRLETEQQGMQEYTLSGFNSS